MTILSSLQKSFSAVNVIVSRVTVVAVAAAASVSAVLAMSIKAAFI